MRFVVMYQYSQTDLWRNWIIRMNVRYTNSRRYLYHLVWISVRDLFYEMKTLPSFFSNLFENYRPPIKQLFRCTLHRSKKLMNLCLQSHFKEGGNGKGEATWLEIPELLMNRYTHKMKWIINIRISISI